MVEKKKNNSRWVLPILIALFLGPLLAAWILYFSGSWRPEGLAHHGSLVESAANLAGDETESAESIFKGKWTIIQVNPGPCESACQELEGRLRAVRLALTHRRDRVQRVLFAESFDGNEDGSTDLTVLDASDSQGLLDVLAGVSGGAVSDTVFLSDPLGNLVITYPKDVTQKAMLEDLKRLLRLSRIG